MRRKLVLLAAQPCFEGRVGMYNALALPDAVNEKAEQYQSKDNDERYKEFGHNWRYQHACIGGFKICGLKVFWTCCGAWRAAAFDLVDATSSASTQECCHQVAFLEQGNSNLFRTTLS